MKYKQFYRDDIKKTNWIQRLLGNLKFISSNDQIPLSIQQNIILSTIFTSDNSEDLDDSTTLKVHFKDLTCIKYRRDMYMTWDGLFGKL